MHTNENNCRVLYTMKITSMKQIPSACQWEILLKIQK